MASRPVAESSEHLGLLAGLPVLDGATTSKVTVNNPLLRVVDFAFDAGQLLTEHSSPRAVVVTLLTGAMRFTVEGVERAMAPGDVIYLAPGARHALVVDEPAHMQLVMVDVDAAGQSG